MAAAAVAVAVVADERAHLCIFRTLILYNLADKCKRIDHNYYLRIDRLFFF